MSRLLASIYDRFMRKTEQACLSSWRGELLLQASGAVLDVGAGTGANLEHFPTGLERLVLAEPDPHMRRRLVDRAAQTRPDASIIDAPIERMPMGDAEFDTVVCTLVLCTVPDPAGGLAELMRVLKPGGRLIYMEHVAGEPGSSRARWQRRAEPFWKPIAGGCHVTRDTHATIEAAGFVIEREQRESMRKALPIIRPTIRGVAYKRPEPAT